MVRAGFVVSVFSVAVVYVFSVAGVVLELRKQVLPACTRPLDCRVLLLSFENSFVVELLVAFGEDHLRIDFCNFLLCNGDLHFISGICQFLEAMRQCQTDEEALLFKDEAPALPTSPWCRTAAGMATLPF